MLAASPSPRVTPVSSPTLNDFRKRSHSNSHPIAKARGPNVFSYPSTGETSTNSSNTTPTNSNSHQCHLPDQRFSFQPQAPQHAPRSYSTISRGTQTSPSRLELQEPKTVQMVDAQTQFSPALSSRAALTPATEIANLQLHETSSASGTASSSSSPSIHRPKRFDPVADAAMSHGQTAASTPRSSSKASQSVLSQSNPPTAQRRDSQTQLRRTHSSSATKRNHSASSESAQPATGLQNVIPPPTPASTSQNTNNPSSAKKMRPDEAPIRRLPTDYSQCPPRDLVALISSMLLELIRFNDAIPLRDGHLTRFHSRAPPGISVLDYLQRLTTHATLSPPILLSMVFYIDKLCALYPAFTISSLTVHRFLITAATVASKGLSDSFWTNKTYAKVGGVSLRELALLEMELIRACSPEQTAMTWRSSQKITTAQELIRTEAHRVQVQILRQ